MSVRKYIQTNLPKLGPLIHPFFGGSGHILMFHRICPTEKIHRISSNAGMEISPEHLETIIHFFKARDYVFLSLDQLKEWLVTKSRKEKCVLFTFDDGYADNLHFAYPVFKKYDIPFTIYITTNFPERTAILWWYHLEDLIQTNDHQIEIDIGDNTFSFLCRSVEEKEVAFSNLRNLILKTLLADRTQSQLKKIFDPFQIDLYKKTGELALSWDQIKQINNDPLVTIGAHTVNHLVLSELSEEDAQREIVESKKMIESHLNENISHFSFPFGSESDAWKREFRMIKDCGFETGVTTRFSNIYRKHRHHMECLPRIFINPQSDPTFLNQVINGTASLIQNRL